MSEGNVSLADGGCTVPSGAEVFLFHEVALRIIGLIMRYVKNQ